MSGLDFSDLRVSKVLAVAVLVAALSLGSVGTADATGSAFISGCCAPTTYTFYTTARTITTPGLFGPEVAFRQNNGSPDLFMGATNCGQGGTSFVFGGVWAQTPGVWRTVGLTSSPATFCIGAGESSNPTAGFDGDLAWD